MNQIILACEESEATKSLRQFLEGKGYVVKTIASGRPTPVAHYGDMQLIGYREIMTYF